MHAFRPLTSVLGTACRSPRCCLPGIDKEQRVHEKQKTIYRNPKVKRSLTIPLLYYICEKGPDHLSLFSLNNFWRKAIVYNKYNYQYNYQSYSSRPDAMSNVLKPFSRV